MKRRVKNTNSTLSNTNQSRFDVTNVDANTQIFPSRMKNNRSAVNFKVDLLDSSSLKSFNVPSKAQASVQKPAVSLGTGEK